MNKPGTSEVPLGTWGEDRAAEYLRAQGYEIVDRNFRCRYGEVDIVAKTGRYLVFAEVKLRKSADYGFAREAVTYSKQQKLRTTALCWLQAHPPTRLQPRFDVLEVYAPQGTATVRPTVNHLENAF